MAGKPQWPHIVHLGLSGIQQQHDEKLRELDIENASVELLSNLGF